MTNVIPLYPRSAEHNVRQGSLTQTPPVSPWLHPLTDRDCRALLMHERRVQWVRHYRCKHKKHTLSPPLPVFTPSRSLTNKQRWGPLSSTCSALSGPCLQNFEGCWQMCKIKEVPRKEETHTHFAYYKTPMLLSQCGTLFWFVSMVLMLVTQFSGRQQQQQQRGAISVTLFSVISPHL